MAKKFKPPKQEKEYPYYPSMFVSKKKRPSGKGRVLTADMEARGLTNKIRENTPKDMHVIHIKDKETGETFKFFDPYEKRNKKKRVWLEAEGTQDGFLVDGYMMLYEADVVIMQNGLGFDLLAFKKVFPALPVIDFLSKPRGGKKRKHDYPFRFMDTMVMSQLLNPERRPPPQAYAMGMGNVGPHSIEAHGIRMGRYKPENECWKRLTDHMLHRCAEDVEIGEDFYDFLMEEWYEQSAPHPITGLDISDAYRLEAVMCNQMALQAARGFRLDFNWAWELVKRLDAHMQRIMDEAMPHMPLQIVMKKLSHTALSNAASKAGYDYPLHGKVEVEELVPIGAANFDKYNKKLLKSWVKAGGKKKHFIKRRYKVKKSKQEITHGSHRATIWKPWVQNGNYSAYAKKDFPEYATGNINDHKDPVIAGPYTPVVWEEVSLGNRDIVRQVLYKHGWRGINFTKGEQEYVDKHEDIPYFYAGKLDDDSMDAWSKRAEKKGLTVPSWAKDILEYYVVVSRRGQILNKKDMDYFEKNGVFPKQQNGKRELRGLVPRAREATSGKEFQDLIKQFGTRYWHKKMFSEEDEFRVPAEAFAIGTNTFRMRHKYVVNIPSRGLYGKDMRRLFIASKGYKILGCDGAGLELRMLSHFMNDPAYEAVILDGDIHTHNQTLAGLPERDMAKTFIYAFLYGSGLLNLALTCGVTKGEMEEMVERFMRELPALDELVEGVKSAARNKGYMKAVDGRWGRVRKQDGKAKEHTALNVLLQMTGSLCMKWGLYFALEYFRKAGIEARLVANVHDEVQMEVPENQIEELVYKIKKADWKAEEKKVVHHENGDYYSAPRIIKEGKNSLTVRRTYHKAGHLLCKGFEYAGEYLGIRTPLAGEYMIGHSWMETH